MSFGTTGLHRGFSSLCDLKLTFILKQTCLSSVHFLRLTGPILGLVCQKRRHFTQLREHLRSIRVSVPFLPTVLRLGISCCNSVSSITSLKACLFSEDVLPTTSHLNMCFKPPVRKNLFLIGVTPWHFIYRHLARLNKHFPSECVVGYC